MYNNYDYILLSDLFALNTIDVELQLSLFSQQLSSSFSQQLPSISIVIFSQQLSLSLLECFFDLIPTGMEPC